MSKTTSHQLEFPVNVEEGADLSNFRRVEDRRHPDPRFHYEFSLKKSWAQAADHSKHNSRFVEVPHPRFLELSRFHNSQFPNASVAVSYSIIDRDCGSAEWLDIVQTKEEFVTEKRRDTYTGFGSQSDVLATRKSESGTEVRRSLGLKDGNRVFRITCTCDQQDYGALAKTFYVVVSTFHLLSPEGEHSAEPIAEFQSANLSFAHPASWQAIQDEHTGSLSYPDQSDEQNGEASYVELFDSTSSQKNTRIVVAQQTGSAMSLDQFKTAYLKRLREFGIKPLQTNVKAIETPDSISAAYFFEVLNDNDQIESNFMIVESHGRLCLIGLITPPYSLEPISYAFNKRAFEIIRDSLIAQMNQ